MSRVVMFDKRVQQYANYNFIDWHNKWVKLWSLKSIIYNSLTQFKEWLIIKNIKSIIEKRVFIFEKSKQNKY
jgi:hypothetical protein